MIKYEFNINKIKQIVNFLLKENNGKINYTKLIKLLYLSDRLMLEKCNDVITGDKFVNMPRGQVVSTIYDLIKGKAKREYQASWDSLFIKDGYDLKFLVSNNLNDDELSEAEIEILKEIDKKFKKDSCKKIIDYIHTLPEWQDPKGSSKPLSYEKVLKAVHKSKKEIEYIQKENQSYLMEKETLKKCYA